MIVYRISDALADGLEPPQPYHGTLASAHKDAKLVFLSPGVRARARIESFDVSTSKAGILALMNWGANKVTWADEPLRTWGLSPRGGLISLENGQ